MLQRWRRSPTWFGTEAEQVRRASNPHTNACNCLASRDEFLRVAFPGPPRLCAEHIAEGLDDTLPRREHLSLLMLNLATFPQENRGPARVRGGNALRVCQLVVLDARAGTPPGRVRRRPGGPN